jgi:hypothetical protein
MIMPALLARHTVCALSHCSYTVDTLLLHCCYTVVTLYLRLDRNHAVPLPLHLPWCHSECYGYATLALHLCHSGCCNDFTAVLQWCCSGVTVVLQWCSSNLIEASTVPLCTTRENPRIPIPSVTSMHLHIAPLEQIEICN